MRFVREDYRPLVGGPDRPNRIDVIRFSAAVFLVVINLVACSTQPAIHGIGEPSGHLEEDEIFGAPKKAIQDPARLPAIGPLEVSFYGITEATLDGNPALAHEYWPRTGFFLVGDGWFDDWNTAETVVPSTALVAAVCMSRECGPDLSGERSEWYFPEATGVVHLKSPPLFAVNWTTDTTRMESVDGKIVVEGRHSRPPDDDSCLGCGNYFGDRMWSFALHGIFPYPGGMTEITMTAKWIYWPLE